MLISYLILIGVSFFFSYFYGWKSGLPSNVQPERCMICLAAQIPQRTQTPSGCFWINWDRNPPTKASPAPFVSTISSNFSGTTGNSSTLSPWMRRTGCWPWVITAILCRFSFCLGSLQIFLPISFKSSVSQPCSFANASVSYIIGKKCETRFKFE